jgi:hypothetical protein
VSLKDEHWDYLKTFCNGCGNDYQYCECMVSNRPPEVKRVFDEKEAEKFTRWGNR